MDSTNTALSQERPEIEDPPTYSLNVLPFGKIIGINQVTYDQIMQANSAVTMSSYCFGRGMFMPECVEKRTKSQIRSDADSNLALWNSRKELLNKEINFQDRAGKSRSIRLSASIDRSSIETTTDVVVGNADVGSKNYGQQRIFKPQGHHFYNLNKDNYTLSTCTYFPGMKINGDSFGTKYSIFDYWWGSYSVDFSINPGSFKYDRFETCNLLKVNATGNQDNLISLIGLKAPKFLGASLSGLAFDVDIGIFGWFVTTILAVILNFIPVIGTFLSAALIASVVIITETNLPAQIAQTYMNQTLDRYDSADSWNRILNNFNSSEANIKSGGYLKDLVTISLLKNSVLPAFKEQMAAHSKIELLRKIDPGAVAALEKAERDALEIKAKADKVVADAKALRDQLEAQFRLERDRFRLKRYLANEM